MVDDTTRMPEKMLQQEELEHEISLLRMSEADLRCQLAESENLMIDLVTAHFLEILL